MPGWDSLTRVWARILFLYQRKMRISRGWCYVRSFNLEYLEAFDLDDDDARDMWLSHGGVCSGSGLMLV